MDLQTKIPLFKQSHNLINYESNLLLLGSCFAENIGEKLEYFKFKSVVNPFGILFHPLAIEKIVMRSINEETFTEEDVFFLNERWHSFDVHSNLSTSSKEVMLQKLNEAVQHTSRWLKETSHIIITLGSSWVYRHIKTDLVVANCHKVPQKEFLKELLSVDDIINSLQATVAMIKEVNPKVAILFTVSPVRHLKDGFIENSRSKANLISAVNELVEPRQQLYYFPSYELMMDELRDYRFYAQDMIHPNTVAVNYIWDRFTQIWMTDSSLELMKEVDTIQKGLSHKPFNPESDQHKKFLLNLNKKIESIKERIPNIRF